MSLCFSHGFCPTDMCHKAFVEVHIIVLATNQYCLSMVSYITLRLSVLSYPQAYFSVAIFFYRSVGPVKRFTTLN